MDPLNSPLTPFTPPPAAETHPHRLLLIAGGAVLLLIIAGVIIVGSSTNVSVQPQNIQTFGSEGAGFGVGQPLSSQQGPGIGGLFSEDDLFANLANENIQIATNVGIPQIQSSVKPTITNGIYTYDGPNLEQLISSISASAYISPTDVDPENSVFQSTNPLEDIYSFLPSGIISTSTLIRSESTEQRKLREYANRAGIDIETYNDAWGTRQAAILKKFVEDKTDPLKKAEVLELAAGLAKVGKELETLTDIPPQVLSAHNTLSAQYKVMGARTSAVAEAKNEDEFLAAILASNADADTLAKAYIHIAETMSAYNVHFENNEAGRVFAFTRF